MTAADRRERERTALRAKILEAARALFVEEGVEAVTMRRIADAIEYTPPVLYAHFRDKAELLLALCEADMALFLAALERASRESDPVERIRRMGRRYVEFGLAHPHHYRLLFMAALPPESCALRRPEELETDPGQRAYGLLRSAVAESIESGRFSSAHRDAERATQVLWGAAHGVLSLWLVRGSDPNIDWRAPLATAHALLDASLDGMCAGARTAKRKKGARS